MLAPIHVSREDHLLAVDVAAMSDLSWLWFSQMLRSEPCFLRVSWNRHMEAPLVSRGQIIDLKGF